MKICMTEVDFFQIKADRRKIFEHERADLLKSAEQRDVMKPHG